MKQSIYIQCEQCLLSRKMMLALLTLSFILVSSVFLLVELLKITEINAYYFYSIGAVMAMFSLYHLHKEKQANYIYLTPEEVWFKENEMKETRCLRFEKVDHFETRFSKIIFSTKEEEKVVMELNNIRDEKKRWEIKEFLKSHVKQLRDHESQLLATA